MSEGRKLIDLGDEQAHESEGGYRSLGQRPEVRKALAAEEEPAPPAWHEGYRAQRRGQLRITSGDDGAAWLAGWDAAERAAAVERAAAAAQPGASPLRYFWERGRLFLRRDDGRALDAGDGGEGLALALNRIADLSAEVGAGRREVAALGAELQRGPAAELAAARAAAVELRAKLARLVELAAEWAEDNEHRAGQLRRVLGETAAPDRVVARGPSPVGAGAAAPGATDGA